MKKLDINEVKERFLTKGLILDSEEYFGKETSIGKITMNDESDIVRDGYIKDIILNMMPKLEDFKNKD